MRAAYYEKNGSAREVLRVGEVDTPQAGPGEVRVKLATSGVNPSDVKSRQGTTRKIAWPRVIPHSDGAGVIDQVGDGVAEIAHRRAGLGVERAMEARLRHRRRIHRAAGGAGGEAAGRSQLRGRRLPRHSGDDRLSRRRAGGCRQGHHLLIAGGAGAVGQYAIQFAKARGATVITTVSSPEKAAAAREAGADHTIDYKREDVGERVMEITGKRGVDAVIEMDLAANAKLIPVVLRPKGSVIVYGTGAAAAILPASSAWPIHPRAILPGLRARRRRARARGLRHQPRARAGQADHIGWRSRPMRSPTSPPPMRRWSAARSAM